MSLMTSPIAMTVYAMFTAATLFTLFYIIWSFNLNMVEQGYLTKNKYHNHSSNREDAVEWCFIELLGMMGLISLCSGLYMIIDATRDHYKKDMIQFDLESVAWSK